MGKVRTPADDVIPVYRGGDPEPISETDYEEWRAIHNSVRADNNLPPDPGFPPWAEVEAEIRRSS